MNIEKWISDQAKKHIYSIARIQDLIKKEKATKFDIDLIIDNKVVELYSMARKASEIINQVEAEVRARYKGIKLN